jgi:hypothetical protein
MLCGTAETTMPPQVTTAPMINSHAGAVIGSHQPLGRGRHSRALWPRPRRAAYARARFVRTKTLKPREAMFE